MGLIYIIIDIYYNVVYLHPWMEIVRGLDFNTRTEFINHFRLIVADLNVKAGKTLIFAKNILPYGYYDHSFSVFNRYPMD